MTRWLDYFSVFGPLQQGNLAQNVTNLAKYAQHFAKKEINLQKFARLVNFCQSFAKSGHTVKRLSLNLLQVCTAGRRCLFCSPVQPQRKTVSMDNSVEKINKNGRNEIQPQRGRSGKLNHYSIEFKFKLIKA